MATIHWDGDRNALVIEVPEAIGDNAEVCLNIARGLQYLEVEATVKIGNHLSEQLIVVESIEHAGALSIAIAEIVKHALKSRGIDVE